MLSKLRARLSFANVTSLLALFVALGGTAYAANTIGSADVIDESLLSQDVKNGEVKNPDLGTNSVTSSRIATGNVFNSDLAADSVNGSKVIANSLTAGDLAPSSVNTSEVADNSLTGDDIDESKLNLPDPSPSAQQARPREAGAYAHVVNGAIDPNYSKNVHVTETGTGVQCLTADWTFESQIGPVSTTGRNAVAQIDVSGADTRDRVGLTM